MAPIVIYLADITKDDQDGKHHSTCHPMMSHTPSRTSTKYHNQITTLQNDLLVNKNTKITACLGKKGYVVVVVVRILKSTDIHDR